MSEKRYKLAARVHPIGGKYVTDSTGPTISVACPTCGEGLGDFRASGVYSARWWADKALYEHEDERHD